MKRTEELTALFDLLEEMRESEPRLYLELSAALCAYAQGYLETKKPKGKIIPFDGEEPREGHKERAHGPHKARL